MKSMVRLGLLLCCMSYFVWAQPSQTVFPDMSEKELAKAIMNDQYGNTFDSQTDCWVVKGINKKHEKVNYCYTYRVTRSVKKTDADIFTITTFNRSPSKAKDIRKIITPFDQNTRHDIGIMWLEKNRGELEWRYVAQTKHINIPENSSCCLGNKLVKISNQEDYGWELVHYSNESYGSAYSLFIPKNGDFINILDTPERTKEEEDFVYKLEFMASPKELGFYPIHIEKVFSLYYPENERNYDLNDLSLWETTRQTLYFDQKSFSYKNKEE